jgi:hypothetical protein
MKTFQLISTGVVLLTISGCADARGVLGPTDAALEEQGQVSEASTQAARRVAASGHFDALVDFSTLTLTPRGRNCLLQVDGRLVFSGTIEGTASGTTRALVFAPCSEVATNPPGTFRDVFKSELRFEGTVDGEPAEANLLYMGRVQPGGQIEGRLVFSNGVAGRLEVDAQVAVGGEYRGSVVVR